MGSTERDFKKDYIWNTAAGLINASEAVVMSMAVTRMTGLADAGMLTMAFAVGNLMMPIGKFGVRNFQVTDVENRFPFSVYLKARFATVLLMLLAVGGYLGYAVTQLGYSGDKVRVIFAVCMIYVVEAMEDVLWGYYQHRNRLYVGARMFCFRWISILAVFFVMLYATKNLGLALLVCLGVSAGVFLALACLSFHRFGVPEDRPLDAAAQKGELREILSLLKQVFPLFGISILAFYENNAPKYAIDACLTDEIQACYSFVAMPVFVIGLLNNFVYQPTLVPMAAEWEEGKREAFKRRIVRQFLIIGGIAAVCILGAFFLGIPVLSLLYHTDLSAYKAELMILLAASVFLAASGYQSVVLTIMRCQKALLWPHCIVSACAAAALGSVVGKFGTMGAACGYLLLMILLCLLYGCILAMSYRHIR